MTDPTPTKKPRRRLLVLVGILVVLAVLAYFNRARWAAIANARAVQSLETGNFNKCHSWLKASQFVNRRNPETQLILARLLRKEEQLGEARTHLDMAIKWGVSKDIADREKQLLTAQSGALRESLPRLNALLEESWQDSPEVYEAYALGAINARNELKTAYGL